jgi:hypothetical protein
MILSEGAAWGSGQLTVDGAGSVEADHGKGDDE